MKKSDKPTRILLDNNVFIAAIKNPGRVTGSLRLLLMLIKNPTVELVGNRFLLEEMARYAEVFNSSTASLLLATLISRITLVQVEERYVTICKKFMGTMDPADVVHAATCLQTDAVLVTNDKHFDVIKDAKVITVWSISQAIHNVLPKI